MLQESADAHPSLVLAGPTGEAGCGSRPQEAPPAPTTPQTTAGDGTNGNKPARKSRHKKQHKGTPVVQERRKSDIVISREVLKQQQKKDSQLGPILEGKCSLPELYQIRFAKKRDKKEADYSLLVVPEILKEPVMYAGHEAAGHFGSHKTKTLVSKHFYWPKMGKEIIQYCKTCPVCLQWNHHKEAKPLLQPLPVVLTPWSKVALDHSRSPRVPTYRHRLWY